MIDWFASKISMLIFVAVAFSLLLLFLGAQLSAFDFEKRVRVAEDIAQIINTVPNGGAVDYEVSLEKYTLIINNITNSTTVNDATRYFFVRANNITINDAKTLEIKNSNGVVNVIAK